MRVDTLTILKVFDPNQQLQVPFFQRPYVWNADDQWEPLWDDILRVVNDEREDPHHFLGAIILNPPPSQTNGVFKMHIIDGQQRLLTIQIILAAARDVANAMDLFAERNQLEEMVQNSSSFVESQDEYLKIMPAIPDRTVFKDIILGIHNDRNYASDLFKCYSFFRTKIERHFHQSENMALEQNASKLTRVLQYGLRVVRIDIDNKEDPQVIFESLNARSQPLTAADLIKNFLVYESDQDANRVDISDNDKVWRMFLTNFWREENSLGKQAYPMIDMFFFHYLSMKMAKEAHMSSLYREFKRWYKNKNQSAAALLDDIERYGRIYRHLNEPTTSMRDYEFLQKLKLMKMTTMYPLLMYIYGHEVTISEEQQNRILSMLESLVIRRSVFIRSNKDYLHYFCQILAELNGTSPLDEEIERLLLGQGLSTRWPHDFELREQMPIQPIRPIIAELVLREIAAFQEGNEGGNSFDKWRVEYLLPRNWSDHQDAWPIGSDHREHERRESLLKTIGNMTLVRKRLRRDDSALDWHIRRTLLNDNGEILMNHKLPMHLNEEAIETRSRFFADMVCTLWPRSKREDFGYQSSGRY